MQKQRDMLSKYQKYAIDPNDFKILRSIGSNATSQTYSVINVKTRKVCVAKVLKSCNNETIYKHVVNQIIGNLIKCLHPTLNKFVGFSLKDFDGKTNATIFIERAENSLAEVLQNNNILTNTNRQIILVGIARAMMYLHQNQIVNLNLKPENVLLDEKYHPYLTDFCISNLCEKVQEKDKNQHTISDIYTAPEAIEKNLFSEKADVYSFGILMYQIVTNRFPFSSLQKNSKNDELSSVLNKIVTENYRPEFTVPVKNSIKTLIEKCWSKDPSERPNFEELFKKLSYNIEDSVYDIYNFDKRKDDEIDKYYLDNADIEKVILYSDNIDNPILSAEDDISSKLLSLKESIEGMINPLKTENADLKNENGKLKAEIQRLKMILLQNDKNNEQTKVQNETKNESKNVNLDIS